MKRDLMKGIPEVLDAIERVQTTGFFVSLDANVSFIPQGTDGMIKISGTGYLPLRPKKGWRALPVDATEIVRIIREELAKKSRRMTRCDAEAKFQEWHKWDKAEENIIGSEGQQLDFRIVMIFARKRRKGAQ